MRSALIIASFALTLLAAPVPVAESQAAARRDIADNTAPIETTIDKRYTRTKDGRVTTSRDVPAQEVEVEKRGWTRLTHTRSEDNEEAEVEKRSGTRLTHPRSEDNVEVEKRSGTRLTHPRSEDDAEVEKRSGTRLTHPRSEDDVEVEKRSGTRLTHPRSEDDVEVEKRGWTRLTHTRSEDNEEIEVEKRGNSSKSPIRSVYDGVVEMIEALKTRGFNSGNNVPAREPM